MNYEVIDATWVSVPKKKESDPTKLQIFVNVTTGVVGDTHGFTKTDTIEVECDIALTGTQMEAEVLAQVTAFSANKYPNV